MSSGPPPAAGGGAARPALGVSWRLTAARVPGPDRGAAAIAGQHRLFAGAAVDSNHCVEAGETPAPREARPTLDSMTLRQARGHRNNRLLERASVPARFNGA